jgi:predicted nucleic-acid-binding protein
MRTEAKPFAIDANVIVRYLVQDGEALSAKAAAIMESVEDGGTTVLCDPVTLAEVVWVLASYYKAPRERISAGLGPILKADGFLMPDKDRYIRALELYSGSVAHFGDACACATALENCGGRLLSFDHKLSAIDGVHRAELPDGI